MQNQLIDINILPLLIQQKDRIFLDEVPFPFRADIIHFISGRTLNGCENGRIRIGEKLYKKWLNKIWNKGFYNEINLHSVE